MQTEETQPQVAQDLLDKVQAIKALVTAHSLLGVGLFQVCNHKQVEESLNFLMALHSQVMQEALAHPDADKIQELVDYKNQNQPKTGGQ